MRTRWFFFFFLISGFCSLVYEVVWLRLSMAKFGVTTAMVSIVLSVFMAGLGIGSWAGGRLMRRFERSAAATALRLYGAVELLIGVSGLVAWRMLDAGYGLVRHMERDLSWGSSSYYLVSGAIVSVALLPWCTLMGATFPIAMAAIRAINRGGSERSFSYLYLANVMGAVLGTLVPAFVLIELYGFRGTMRIASALNFLLAAVVYLLSMAPLPASSAPGESAPAGPAPGGGGRGLLGLLFATGLCSMAMEVVWVRLFTVYLGNVVYAFATILAVYLTATFLGSWFYRWRSGRHALENRAWLWISLGVLGLLPLVMADPRLASDNILSMDGDLFWGGLRALAGLAPFSALLGFLTPMLVDRWSGGDPEKAGRAYAVNVVGSILGPLIAGFLVLPLLGERWGLWAISLLLIVLGAVGAIRPHGGGAALLKPPPRWFFASAVALSLLLAVGTEGYETALGRRVELRDYTATVVAAGKGLDSQLLVNGTGMTKLATITKLMAHLPLSLLERPAGKGLVICFGMGTSFRSMLSWGIDTTAVELVPSVPKLFGYFHSDGPRLLQSLLAHVVIDDGRRFLDRSREQYDVIITDPPPPVGAPASSLLYSREFYATVKPRLKAGGILQVWFPGDDAVTRSAVAKALVEAFPYVRAYESVEGWGLHFLASMTPIRTVDGAELARRLPAAAAADLVEWEQESGATTEEILSDLVSAEKSVGGFIRQAPSAPPIDDDRPVNEYFMLRNHGWARAGT